MKKTTDAQSVKFIDEESGIIEGYASTFGPPADRVGDIVFPGAFGTKQYQVPLLAYHDAKQPIGVAVHTPDQHGLWTRAELADTAFAQDQCKLFKIGAIPAFSIGYDFKNKANSRNDEGGWDLHQVQHYETSGVPIPANPRALVTMAKSWATKQPELMADPDEDPVELAEAVDALLDTIAAELAAGNVDQADSLVVAALVTADALIEALGGVDADEPGDEPGEPPEKRLRRLRTKRGARNSTMDQKALDAAHAALVAAGANCSPAKAWTGKPDEARQMAGFPSLASDLLLYELEALK